MPVGRQFQQGPRYLYLGASPAFSASPEQKGRLPSSSLFWIGAPWHQPCPAAGRSGAAGEREWIMFLPQAAHFVPNLDHRVLNIKTSLSPPVVSRCIFPTALPGRSGQPAEAKKAPTPLVHLTRHHCCDGSSHRGHNTCPLLCSAAIIPSSPDSPSSADDSAFRYAFSHVLPLSLLSPGLLSCFLRATDITMANSTMLSKDCRAVQYKDSTIESCASAPGQDYSFLFATSPADSDSTSVLNQNNNNNNNQNDDDEDDDAMTPSELSSPPSQTDSRSRIHLTPISEADTVMAAPESYKKPAKKRKSWGQVLPEPKTNLPPRKRAKTEDEKEQRRVERVLRNRRAAQSSRERKRLEVEALEKRNKQLEEMLVSVQKTNSLLVEELNRFRHGSGYVSGCSSPLDPLHDNPVTLSQDLFGTNTVNNTKEQTSPPLMAGLINPTVNPASLSPEPTVVDSVSKPFEEATAEVGKPVERSSETAADLTQRPAEMLCDLPCHTSVASPKSFLASQTSMDPRCLMLLQLKMMLLSASAILSVCQRPLTQIALSSRAGFSLLPSPQLLTTIIWLVTIPPASRNNQTSTSSISTPSSTTTQPISPTLWQRATMPQRTSASTSWSSTLRLKHLRKILSSSPNLARPLTDATMVALRLVSEVCDDRVETKRPKSEVACDVDRDLTQCLRSVSLPSKEVLLTLLWALSVEEQRMRRRNGIASLGRENSASSQHQASHRFVLQRGSDGRKRKSQAMRAATGSFLKRFRSPR